MATPNRLSTVPFNEPGENPMYPPTYVSARALAATTAESITVPAGANYVRIAATCNIFINYTTTASVPGDVDDGTASELIPVSASGAECRIITGIATLSVITGDSGGGVVTASFYTA